MGEQEERHVSLLKQLAETVVKRVASSERAQAVLKGMLSKVTLADLTDSFRKAGLDKVLASWIAQGKNEPISPAQVREVMGHDRLRALADEHGVSEDEAARLVAGHLPDVIDQLTPGGTLPAEGPAPEQQQP
jgi:uncharacterized protein YidB (DUF937 family)